MIQRFNSGAPHIFFYDGTYGTFLKLLRVNLDYRDFFDCYLFRLCPGRVVNGPGTKVHGKGNYAWNNKKKQSKSIQDGHACINLAMALSPPFGVHYGSAPQNLHQKQERNGDANHFSRFSVRLIGIPLPRKLDNNFLIGRNSSFLYSSSRRSEKEGNPIIGGGWKFKAVGRARDPALKISQNIRWRDSTFSD
jgi:hypothetical protein